MADDPHLAVRANRSDLTGPPMTVRCAIGEREARGNDLGSGNVLGQVAGAARNGPAELRHQRQPCRIPRGTMEIGAFDARRAAGDDHGPDADGVSFHDDDQMCHPASHDVGQSRSVRLAGRCDDDEIGVWSDGDT